MKVLYKGIVCFYLFTIKINIYSYFVHCTFKRMRKNVLNRHL